MSTSDITITNTNDSETIERVLISGDLTPLTPTQRVQYYFRVCESLGLNHLTRPFDYTVFQGRTVLYARKDCTDQLRRIHGISISIIDRTISEDMATVVCRGSSRDGRSDESMGAVWVKGQTGEAKCNSLMKAETKARRRTTLSICGLGILDETELVDAAVPPQQTRMSDRVVAGSTPLLQAQTPDPETEPAPRKRNTKAQAVSDDKQTPSWATTPEAKTSRVVVIDKLTEHKSVNGPVWQVLDDEGGEWVVTDGSLVSELGECRSMQCGAGIEWKQLGSRKIITSVIPVPAPVL